MLSSCPEVPIETPSIAGRASLVVERVAGQSAVVSLQAHSPMKVLAPVSRGLSVWACTSSFGGGMVAGDQTELEIQVGEGARCHVTSQASTKIYRNPKGLPCGHVTRATVGPGGLLSYVPDPVQTFAGARYAQRQEFDLAEGAGLVLVDWFGSGRAACGERWAFEHYSSRTRVRSEGQPRLMDAIHLDGGEGALEGRHRLGRFNCVAMLLVMGIPFEADAARCVEEVGQRPVGRSTDLVLSASPVEGGCLVRAAAVHLEALTREIRSLLTFLPSHLGDDPWTRKW